MGVLTETKKTPRLSRGGHRPEHIHAWLRKRGSDFQGRLCPIARSWELAVFFLLKGET